MRGGRSFAPSGLTHLSILSPTADAVGCILSPLRGWNWGAGYGLGRTTFLRFCRAGARRPFDKLRAGCRNSRRDPSTSLCRKSPLLAQKNAREMGHPDFHRVRWAKGPGALRAGCRRYFLPCYKKKTGLVGPASSASSWMRLHHSAARQALRVLSLLRASPQIERSDQQEETDRRVGANGVPCIYSFRCGQLSDCNDCSYLDTDAVRS